MLHVGKNIISSILIYMNCGDACIEQQEQTKLELIFTKKVLKNEMVQETCQNTTRHYTGETQEIRSSM